MNYAAYLRIYEAGRGVSRTGPQAWPRYVRGRPGHRAHSRWRAIAEYELANW